MPSEDTTRKKDESRRDFLKTSAAVGGAVATTFTAANAVHAQGSDILKIGLIGCGGRGTGAAVNAGTQETSNSLEGILDSGSDTLKLPPQSQGNASTI